MESHAKNEDQRLEIYTGQEIKTVVKRFEMIEEIIGADGQGEKVKGLTSPVHVRVRADFSFLLCNHL